jgi:FkbM family methyltransferase
VANKLYRWAPSLYVPLYRLYKTATERAELKAIRQAIKPGMRCADIGANIGFVTAELSRLAGAKGKVYAFEPSPANFALLRRRLSRPNVTLVEAAAGATNGEVQLHLSDHLNVDHRTYPTQEARRQIEVRLVTLDDFIQEESLDFVKLDVQGYELEVLKGMTRLLRSSPRLTMLMEFWPWGLRRAGGSPEEVLETLRSAGLRIAALSGSPVAQWEEEPTWYRNILAHRP